MKGLDFLENINDIDDELIDAAAKKWNSSAVTASRKPLIFIAAGAAIAVALVLLVVGLNSGWGRKPDGEGPAVVSLNETTDNTKAETTNHKEITTSEETVAETTSSQITTEDNSSNSSNVVPDNPEEDYEPEQDHSDNDDGSEYEPEADNNDPEPIQPEQDYSDNDYAPEYEPEADNNVPEPIQPEYRVIAIEIAYPEEEMNNDAFDNEGMVLFWEDSEHMYYINTAILNRATVIYESGEIEDLVSALNNGHIDISDLDAFGIPYYTD